MSIRCFGKRDMFIIRTRQRSCPSSLLNYSYITKTVIIICCFVYVSVCGFYSSVSYIEMAVPSDVGSNEAIFKIPILREKEIPGYQIPEFFLLNGSSLQDGFRKKKTLKDVLEGSQGTFLKTYGAHISKRD